MYIDVCTYNCIWIYNAYNTHACVYTLSIIIQKLTEIYQIIYSYLEQQYDSSECNEKGILNPCSMQTIN